MGVTAILPAFNEEKNLGGVLAPLLYVKEITQIIVVSDGSTDGTIREAENWGAQVVDLPENMGKAAAMSKGLQQAEEDIILFLDADLIGLTSLHVEDLIMPVILGEADMTVGIFAHGRFATDVAQVITPFLSGQRCVHKKWLFHLNDWAEAGFGIEAALTKYAIQNNLRILHVSLPAMSHVMKEEKYGLMRGFAYRMKMYWEIAKNSGIRGN